MSTTSCKADCSGEFEGGESPPHEGSIRPSTRSRDASLTSAASLGSLSRVAVISRTIFRTGNSSPCLPERPYLSLLEWGSAPSNSPVAAALRCST
jgi:hypothetical protein